MAPSVAEEGGILLETTGALRGGRRPLCTCVSIETEIAPGMWNLWATGTNPWTIDMVATMAAAVLIVGFAIALAALWIR
jgi:hypothetical protein